MDLLILKAYKVHFIHCFKKSTDGSQWLSVRNNYQNSD